MPSPAAANTTRRCVSACSPTSPSFGPLPRNWPCSAPSSACPPCADSSSFSPSVRSTGPCSPPSRPSSCSQRTRASSPCAGLRVDRQPRRGARPRDKTLFAHYNVVAVLVATARRWVMPIDFTLPPEVEDVRLRVRKFMEAEVKPVADDLQRDGAERRAYIEGIGRLRQRAKDLGLWNPHLPPEWGGMGLGATAMAFVSAEAARVGGIGPYILNAQAPDEGNMHTLYHWATPEQGEKYLRPLADGRARSCFAMTEPEVSGSDPTLIQTRAVKDGDDWLVSGHKWFISGARGAPFAILLARPDEDADPPQARNSAFLVDVPTEGWEIVRDIDTMHGR